MRTWNRLPPDVQQILLEVAADFESLTATNNLERYDADVATLRELITVKELGPEVRSAWATSLKDWPREMAADLDAQGLPGTEVLEKALASAEKYGYTWPVRYEIR
jgi:C4-dicarboxylate-binding protein DctP